MGPSVVSDTELGPLTHAALRASPRLVAYVGFVEVSILGIAFLVAPPQPIRFALGIVVFGVLVGSAPTCLLLTSIASLRRGSAADVMALVGSLILAALAAVTLSAFLFPFSD